jgi:hypothetical protein
VSRIEQSGRISLRRPKPPINGGSAPEEEDISLNIGIIYERKKERTFLPTTRMDVCEKGNSKNTTSHITMPTSLHVGQTALLLDI